MKPLRILIPATFLLAFAQAASADLNVVACEPEWGSLAQELGGGDISVFSATTGLQDPHSIQARPSLIAKVRNADLLVCTGAELEIGWLPILLRQSGNPKIQPSGPGYFEATSYVRMLEVPTRLDRAQGDVHPGGNPHIQTGPHNIARVADALAERMAQLDAGNAGAYRMRHDDFMKRWTEAMGRWEQRAASLKNVTVVTHHKYWAYLINWLHMQEVVTLEPKPGLPPTAAHLEEVLTTLQQQPARMVIRTAYNDAHASEWLSEHAKIPAVELPGTVGGAPGTDNLFSLFDVTVDRLLAALDGGNKS